MKLVREAGVEVEEEPPPVLLPRRSNQGMAPRVREEEPLLEGLMPPT